jgi:hypothetical protein
VAEGERGPVRPSAQSTIVESAPGPVATERPPVPVGTVLGGRYRLLEVLGRGGMGAVYRARDTVLDADVAVKLIDPELGKDPVRLEYFRNEVRVARKVTHPNVCRLHDLVDADGQWLITMQFVEGESLAGRLRRDEVVPIGEALRILRDVAAGLAAAHRAGVVHRDLKPANVLLAEDGRAIVADFGIAAETRTDGVVARDVAGTRGYMAPEQSAGGPIDARCDVYAFGVLAHRVVLGELPWGSPAATDVRPPVPAETPPALLGLIDECLSSSPSDRPASGDALLARLSTPGALAAGAERPGASDAERAGERPVDRMSDSIDRRSDSVDRPSESSVASTTSERSAAPASELATRSGARVGRPIWLVAAVAAAAAALLIWRPWTSGGAAHAPSAAPLEIEVATSAATPLAPDELVDAVTQLAIAELEDGWGVRARAEVAGSARAGARLASRLWIGDDRRLVLEATLSRGDERLTTRLESTSQRGLAIELAAWAARAALPATLLRPTREDMAATCASSPEAWRLWQRSRRESRMQRWSQARDLAERAMQVDPTFPLAPFELSLTYMSEDAALQRSFARSVELAAACPTLSPTWRQIFEGARVSLTGDVAGAKVILDRILATPDLPPSEHLYLNTRWAFGLWFSGERGMAMPLLEWIAEQWPTDPAVPKLLAHYLLEEDEPADPAAARRYARQALTYAPYDVGARADLARALLAAGDANEAAAQARIIDRAEPAEKQGSLAGGEAENSLVALRLELGHWGDAERDARRLLLGPVTERSQGRAALAALELLRGAASSGVEFLVEASRDCKQAGIETTAAAHMWKAAWLAYQAGELGRAAELFPLLEGEAWGGRAAVMLALIDARRGKARADSLARAAAAVTALRPGPSRTFLDMVVAHERADWARVLELGEEMREIGLGGALVPMLLTGDALAASGKPREAEARLRRLATHPRRWKEPVAAMRAWRRLGEVREQLGDRAGAAEAYKALLERLARAPARQPDVTAARAGLARTNGPAQR